MSHPKVTWLCYSFKIPWCQSKSTFNCPHPPWLGGKTGYLVCKPTGMPPAGHMCCSNKRCTPGMCGIDARRRRKTFIKVYVSVDCNLDWASVAITAWWELQRLTNPLQSIHHTSACHLVRCFMKRMHVYVRRHWLNAFCCNPILSMQTVVSPCSFYHCFIRETKHGRGLTEFIIAPSMMTINSAEPSFNSQNETVIGIIWQRKILYFRKLDRKLEN